MKLYHGTSLRRLPAITKRGLKPRSATGKSVWKGTVESHPDTVYLTNAYAIYFANCARKSGEPGVVLEIESDLLDRQKLVADEDAVEQSLRGHDHLPRTMSVKERTEYYRARIHQFSWEASLNVLGTCGYQGVIEPHAITRIAVIQPHAMLSLIFEGGLDPTITLTNYKILGKKYRASLQWLFDGRADEAHMPLKGTPVEIAPGQWINMDEFKYPFLPSFEGIWIKHPLVEKIAS